MNRLRRHKLGGRWTRDDGRGTMDEFVSRLSSFVPRPSSIVPRNLGRVNLSLLLSALVLILATASTALAVTEFVSTIKANVGDYSILAVWEESFRIFGDQEIRIWGSGDRGIRKSQYPNTPISKSRYPSILIPVLMLVFLLTTGTALAATEFVSSIKESGGGGDYTTLTTWEAATKCDLTDADTKVFSVTGVVVEIGG